MLRFGSQYYVGYIGWTRCPGPVTTGIAYGERYERNPQFPQVSHAFIVSGADAGIEAHLDTGVARFPLAKYTSDPNTKIYFRRPARFDAFLGCNIATDAAEKLGAGYDTSLIAADAICDTVLGHWLDVITRGGLRRTACRLLGHPDKFICSELAAWSLNQQREYTGRGCLVNPLDTIDPQELFQDEILFEPGFVAWER